jgi:hypothetical protein
MSDSNYSKNDRHEKTRKTLPRKLKELNDTKTHSKKFGGGSWWLSFPWWKPTF